MSWLNLLGSAPGYSSNSHEFFSAEVNADPNLKIKAVSPKHMNNAMVPSMLDWFFAMTIPSDKTPSEVNEEAVEPQNTVVLPPQDQELLDQYYHDLFRADEFGFINPDSPESNNSAFDTESDLPGIRIDSPSPNFGFYVEMTPPTSPRRRSKMREEFEFAMSEEEGAEIGTATAMANDVETIGTLTPLASRGSAAGAAGEGQGGEEEPTLRWWDYFIL